MPKGRATLQSAGTAAAVLKAVGHLAVPSPLSRIASTAGMPAAKVHRYLQALIAEGLVQQNETSGHYGMGPELIAIGLAALGRLDVTEIAAPLISRLRDTVGQSCILSVWGNKGPTVVRVAQSSDAITIVTRLGSVLPLKSATGLCFLAHLQPGQIDATQIGGSFAGDVDALKAQLEVIRERGQSVVEGMVVPGIAAIAAPIFDASGDCAAVICCLGADAGMDLRPDGPMCGAITQTARDISRQLGFAKDDHNAR